MIVFRLPFGIEHGYDNRGRDEPSVEQDNNYDVKLQLTYPYNQKVFKLLAAIEGREVSSYVDFAYEKRPFASGSKGHFKGNLYPYPCYNLNTWSQEAIEETGFLTKDEYVKWCSARRLPVIRQWIDEYRPRVFIGTGIVYEKQFARAYCGKEVQLDEHAFDVNGYGKRILYKKDGQRLFLVVPHLSGTRHGLNSHESIRLVGEFVRDLMAK